MNRVALLMGRGIEGCGITKFSLEQVRWFKKNNIDVTIFASGDKVWTRAQSHDVDTVKLVKFADTTEAEELVRTIDADFDVLIVNSLPSKATNQTGGIDDDAVKNFIKIIESVKVPMVLVQLDHTKLSVLRNAALEESIKRANVIFTLSSTNDFVHIVDEILNRNGIASFFDDDDVSETPVFATQAGMDYDHCRETYAIPGGTPRLNEHKWIGRTTSWKGYQQMFRFHEKYLRPNGHVTMLEGIERSIALVDVRKAFTFIEHKDDKLRDGNYDMQEGDHAHVFGPYDHASMLKRMAGVGFGYQLSILKDRYIEHSIEFTHSEIACIGVVPVFRKEYGERCMHRTLNKPLIECEGNGTIWLGDDNGEECWEEIKRINSDPAIRLAKVNEAFDFYRDQSDAEFIFAEMWKNITDNV